MPCPTSRPFKTEAPLVVFGATGRLGSQFVFLACTERFSPHIVLHGSHLPRLEGLRAEILESGIDGINVTITTDTEEACAYGGYIFYSRSIPAGKQTREEMLLDNLPMAKETGLALQKHKASIIRVVCVSNPSDIIGLTLLVHSELRPEQVLSLSALDTTRYIRAMCEVLRLEKHDFSGVYTLGSHDMSMAVMRDTVRIKGVSIDECIAKKNMTEEDFAEIRDRVVNGGRLVIKQRGHTAFQSPAYLGYMMLTATDDIPFTYPCSKYHHSADYRHCFFSLPTKVDSRGGHHLSEGYSHRDIKSLNTSYESIVTLRDIAITHGFLPDPKAWHKRLQEEDNRLICSLR